MDRDALVRAVRHRQALDALAFERDRAALLANQLEEMVASVEGVRVDAVLYAQLSPEDVTLVRAAFRDGLDELDEEFDEEVAPESSSGDGEGLDVGPANVGADESEDEDEAEIARLQDELTQSARLQAALERYLDIVREPS